MVLGRCVDGKKEQGRKKSMAVIQAEIDGGKNVRKIDKTKERNFNTWRRDKV